jgi:hypothetical protein
MHRNLSSLTPNNESNGTRSTFFSSNNLAFKNLADFNLPSEMEEQQQFSSLAVMGRTHSNSMYLKSDSFLNPPTTMKFPKNFHDLQRQPEPVSLATMNQ